jgi:membrane-bound lytic murein transglycosylase MltF
MAVVVASYAYRGNQSFDRQLAAAQVAPRLQSNLATTAKGYLQIGRMIGNLFFGRVEARNLPVAAPETDFVTEQINALMREFGAEESSVPSEFVQEVDRFIQQYQERDRDLMLRALVNKRADLEKVREILRRNFMPEDFAYMAVVESGFVHDSISSEGAAGFWQFTEVTARAYGLKVDDTADERLDLTKSTEAASRYIRDLILDFGTGSSVLLAIAAYNSGQEAVRRAMRNVKDPIKQRNFWHLHRIRALPAETREYVPKVFAAIIVGRNPRQLGL